jgi:hypothetical protein
LEKEQQAMSRTADSCDLKKVQHVTFRWVSNNVSYHTKPKGPTVNGQLFDPDGKVVGGFGESLLSYARRKELLDTWVPTIWLKFSANCSLKFTGKRALSILKQWNAQIFGKTNKRKEQ